MSLAGDKESSVHSIPLVAPTTATFDNAYRTSSQPSFVAVGFQRKASPLVLKSWSKLALTLDGRDKITKVLQYVARFLGWYLAGKYNNQAVRFTELYKQLAHSRKAFRMGRSLMEMEKLREMGLVNLLLWHVRNSVKEEGDGPPKAITGTAVSEGGFDAGDNDEIDDCAQGPVKRRTPSVSLGSQAYRIMCKPVLAAGAYVVGNSHTKGKPPTTDLVTSVGSAIKILGLLGFFAGDNINYLSSTGALDNYTLPPKERLAKRKHTQTIASTRANQAYFAGSLGGFVANLCAYIKFRRGKVSTAKEELGKCESKSQEEREEAILELRKVQEKEFSLFLSLVKSCCDIAVFSNQPGVDLHTKLRGKKNHEGLHCLFGLISAATVIYNNFPDEV